MSYTKYKHIEDFVMLQQATAEFAISTEAGRQYLQSVAIACEHDQADKDQLSRIFHELLSLQVIYRCVHECRFVATTPDFHANEDACDAEHQRYFDEGYGLEEEATVVIDDEDVTIIGPFPVMTINDVFDDIDSHLFE